MRLRHVRVEAVRWLYVTGSDFSRDAGFVDRAYQVYVVGIAALSVIALWFYLIDSAVEVGAMLDFATASQVAGFLYVLPVIVFMAVLVRYLRVPLIRMTHPDILWLAHTLRPSAWAAAGFFGAAARAVVWGALGGFVAGSALQAVVSPAVSTAVLAAGFAGAVGFAWLLGATKHVHFRRGLHFDMGSVVRASSLYADLQPLRAWAVQSPAAFEEVWRRRIMSQRKPAFGLPAAEGRRLLMGRAILSHVRQREGLLDLIVWGALVVPAGALAVAIADDAFLVLAWVVVAGLSAERAKEITRVYKDDRRVRLVGDAIVCSRFGLLLLDSLPAMVFVTLLAVAVTIAGVVAWPASADRVLASFCLVGALAATPLFAGGIDAASSSPDRIRPGFELLVVACSLIVALASLAGAGWAALAGCAWTVALGVWAWMEGFRRSS